MRYFLAIYLGSIILATPCAAQKKNSERDPSEFGLPIRKTTADGKIVNFNQPKRIKLEITPAKEPFPALKYTLLPKYKDLKPGNAATNYYRALLHLKMMKRIPNEKHLEYHEKWYEKPLSEKSLSVARKYLDDYGNVFKELEKAVLCDRCDWDMRLREATGIEQISFFLDEIQESRELARLLRLKVHVEITEKKYDQAIKTLQIGFRLASDVAKSESVISNLVGIAIMVGMYDGVLELVGVKDTPNLYWAVAVIPQPFIDLKTSLSLESELTKKLMPAMKDAETANRTPEEWDALLRQGLRDIHRVNSSKPMTFLDQFAVTSRIITGYPHAKRKLIEWGFDPQRVEKMPVAQVVLIHDKRLLDYWSDEFLKWAFLSPRYSIPGSKSTLDKMRKVGFFSRESQESEVLGIAWVVMPASGQILKASSRTDIRLASLRVIEAIRMHAAYNNGQLPDSLADITVVPVPLHPETGKPFPYRKIGNKAVLDVVLIFNPKQKRANYRIEISVRK